MLGKLKIPASEISKTFLVFIFLTILNCTLKVEDCRCQWIQQYTGTNTDFHSVKFINENTGWICGTGVIAKTTNAGLNWIQQTHPSGNKRLNCLCIIDSATLYCVGMFKTLLKSTNGGDNWTAVWNGPYGAGESYNTVFFINKNTGWITGTGAKIWKTTNGGDSLFKLNEVWGSLDMYFKDSLSGLMCGDMGYLKRTTDGGVSWYTPNIELHNVGYTFSKLSTINNQYVWIVGMSGPIYRSLDFGINWDSIGYISEHFDALYSIRFSNISTGWCGGGGVYQGRLFRTTNGGYSWQRKLSDSIPGYVGDICFNNDYLGWAVGSNGMSLHTTNGGVSFVNNSTTNTASSFYLHQNFPNPFNSSTNIRIDIKTKDYYKMEIFNVAGKKIDLIFEGIKTPGIYRFSYDAAILQTGVYFLKIFCSKETQTRKFVLIK